MRVPSDDHRTQTAGPEPGTVMRTVWWVTPFASSPSTTNDSSGDIAASCAAVTVSTRIPWSGRNQCGVTRPDAARLLPVGCAAPITSLGTTMTRSRG